jgi:formylglycine-generating enzyme required for sulfatase activity
MALDVDRRAANRHAPAREPDAVPVPEFARIPAGEFFMGSSESDDERPVHRVWVGEFYIGRFQVTNDDYARFVRAAGHPWPAVRELPMVAGEGRDDTFRQFAAAYEWTDGVVPPGRGAHPVVLIGYDDAAAYCRWLSHAIGRVVRLPTEAEWEKAARGGTEGQRFPWGNDIDPTRGNYLADPGAKRERGTRPCGTYAANAYGLCDMGGNVWEWVSDWYAPDYYAAAASRNPRGPAGGAMRVVRGGSWVNADVGALRCACRHPVPADTYAYSIGFRIVCEP